MSVLNRLQDYSLKNYLRYTDDFVIVAENRFYLENSITPISYFLRNELALELHPQKIIIRKFRQGVDFLGYIIFPYYRLIRKKTKKRIFKKLKKRIKEYKGGLINQQTINQSLQSYLGVLSHANTYILEQKLKNQFWFWLNE